MKSVVGVHYKGVIDKPYFFIDRFPQPKIDQ